MYAGGIEAAPRRGEFAVAPNLPAALRLDCLSGLWHLGQNPKMAMHAFLAPAFGTEGSSLDKGLPVDRDTRME